jgi:hypothetical protein
MSVRHLEDPITLELPPGCRHRDEAGGGVDGHGRLDFSAGDDSERRRRPVEADASRGLQIVPEDSDFRSHLAGGWEYFRERAYAYRQAEDRAATGEVGNAVGVTAAGSSSVELPVGALHQPAQRLHAVGTIRLGAEAVESGELPRGRDFESRAAAVAEVARGIRANLGCTVKVPVGALHQPCPRHSTVGAVRFGAEPVKRGQHSPGCDFEDGAAAPTADVVVENSTGRGCPVKVSISALHQSCDWHLAVRAEAFGTEPVKRGQHSPGCDFEDGAALSSTIAVVGPARRSRPIEVAVRGLHQRREGLRAIGALRLGAELVKGGQLAPDPRFGRIRELTNQGVELHSGMTQQVPGPASLAVAVTGPDTFVQKLQSGLFA